MSATLPSVPAITAEVGAGTTATHPRYELGARAQTRDSRSAGTQRVAEDGGGSPAQGFTGRCRTDWTA